MYKVKVNDQYYYEVELDKNQLKVDGENVSIDRVPLSNGHSHFLYQHRSYNVELLSQQGDQKTVTIKVNGSVYVIAISDQYDQLLQQLGMDNLNDNRVKDIKAPMPGLVLNVMVEVGQEVKKGDNLLVLEAMKMENIIKSSTDGMVKAIQILQGDRVEKNAILLQFH
jgi:biotin carboxyl carrier protein